MTDRYCRLLDVVVHKNDEIKVDIDLCCIDFPFYNMCFMERAQYCLTDLGFEVRDPRTIYFPDAHLLVDWRSVELFVARPHDRPIFYVGIESFDWPSCSYLLLLVARTLRCWIIIAALFSIRTALSDISFGY